MSFVRAAFAAIAVLVCSPAVAQDEAPPPPPRLVVAISIDQFSADLFAQYRQTYTGGLARLLDGAVFPAGFQSHAATETCPGHSTILTGDHPSRTGVVANNWYDLDTARANKRIYCAEDESRTAADPKSYVPSAAHLKVPTLGDWMKRADTRSRNIAVSGKDRAALMMGGPRTDEVYFWFDTRFRTVDGRSEPAELAAVNAEAADLSRTGAKGYALPKWCASTDHPVTAGPASVGTGRLALPAGDIAKLRATPAFDRLTLDLAQRLVTDRQLGKGPAPDLLAVSLSANDYIGHAYGTNGAEMCIQVHELDQSLGRFFAFLDKTGVDYVVVLTADHGGKDLPERLDQQALPQAARADAGLAPGTLGAAIAGKLKIATDGPLLYADGVAGDIWLNRGLTPAQRVAVIAELKRIATEHPQIAAVFTAQELAATPMPAGPADEWSLIERARASFYAPHSGDVVMLLKKDVVAMPNAVVGSVATHGSPWDYDRRVPILFWRKGMTHFEQPAPVETVDIAPTLAALLRLGTPEGAFDGRCLDLDDGPGNTCAR